MEQAVEIFTLVTGVIYVILEIRQKNFMWVLGIFTSLASMWMFFRQGMYASFALQIYYFVTAFVGLWQWRRNKASQESADDTICLRRLSPGAAVTGLLLVVAGTVALSWGMDSLHGLGLLRENPMSLLDASVAATSAVATWWLVRCHIEQWWLWIAANLLTILLCCIGQMWWMALLYVAYLASAVIGLVYWKRNGVYTQDK